ncbi:MAG TPA: MBL fold metallo-hydrolase [Candidatus Binataceae bacterium]|nr:MBL fold metallo-hydrolase [Candidatus Binataceae bacterium]
MSELTAKSGFAPTLRFLGAAGTVTGSRFLIETAQARVMVDCGLFQGLKALRLRNWDRFPIEPRAIDALVLSHAHLDHSGYLPALWRDGYRGKVFTTADTQALCRILLPDSGHLQEEEAAYANRRGYSKHAPARPLYTEDDALRALEALEPRPFGERFAVADGVFATMRRAGHILGAASVAVELGHPRPRTVLFSGDLGRPHHPLLRAPDPPPAADVVVVESTYGDRRHDDAASLALFEQALARTLGRGGVAVIPSFAVDRTEVVMFHLRRLVRAHRLPAAPVYIDSPMASAALKVYRAAAERTDSGLRPEVAREPDSFDPPEIIETRTVEESIGLNFVGGPAIIISASGMATGGRVLHHLANRLPDPRNTVILVGYQADGTRGRRLLAGEPEVKMLGRYVPVKAEVVNVEAFSVHADQGEIIGWLRAAVRRPEIVYVVHGEPPAAAALREAIEKELGWKAAVARHLEGVRL